APDSGSRSLPLSVLFLPCGVVVAHRIQHVLLGLCTTPRLRCLVLVNRQHVLEVPHDASEGLDTVVLREGLAISSAILDMVEQGAYFTLGRSVLLVPVLVRDEHLLVQDHAMTLHGRYKGVNDTAFLLAGTVLPGDHNTLEVVMLRKDGA